MKFLFALFDNLMLQDCTINKTLHFDIDDYKDCFPECDAYSLVDVPTFQTDLLPFILSTEAGNFTSSSLNSQCWLQIHMFSIVPVANKILMRSRYDKIYHRQTNFEQDLWKALYGLRYRQDTEIVRLVRNA
jgi:hypothetical protein